MGTTEPHFRSSLYRAGLVLLGLSGPSLGCTEKSTPGDTPNVAPMADTPSEATPEAVATPDAPPTHGPFRECTQGKFGTPPKSGSFKHRRSKLIAKLGDAAHSAQDILVRPGDPVVVPGKFAYGRVSKDLEDETVVVFLDTCESYSAVGTTLTDDDGRTALAIPEHYVPGVGVYNITQVMRGDASQVSSRLTIAPAGSRLVLFDIDGTLTIGDDELTDELKNVYLKEFYSGKRPPKAYPDAAAVTKSWQAQGYLLVYTTGRPYWLAGLTRK